MSKIIQIAQCEDTLYGLDDDGVLYIYSFTNESWEYLSDSPKSDKEF